MPTPVGSAANWMPSGCTSRITGEAAAAFRCPPRNRSADRSVWLRPVDGDETRRGTGRATHGLDRAHIGAICDALTGAGINPAVWSARTVNDALNADMRARGTTWPDHIANPGGFLATRLPRLSWTPPRDDPDKGRRLRRRQHRPDAAPRGTHRRSAGPDHRGPRRNPPSARRARSACP